MHTHSHFNANDKESRLLFLTPDNVEKLSRELVLELGDKEAEAAEVKTILESLDKEGEESAILEAFRNNMSGLNEKVHAQINTNLERLEKETALAPLQARLESLKAVMLETKDAATTPKVEETKFEAFTKQVGDTTVNAVDIILPKHLQLTLPRKTKLAIGAGIAIAVAAGIIGFALFKKARKWIAGLAAAGAIAIGLNKWIGDKNVEKMKKEAEEKAKEAKEKGEKVLEESHGREILAGAARSILAKGMLILHRKEAESLGIDPKIEDNQNSISSAMEALSLRSLDELVEAHRDPKKMEELKKKISDPAMRRGIEYLCLVVSNRQKASPRNGTIKLARYLGDAVNPMRALSALQESAQNIDLTSPSSFFNVLGSMLSENRDAVADGGTYVEESIGALNTDFTDDERKQFLLFCVAAKTNPLSSVEDIKELAGKDVSEKYKVAFKKLRAWFTDEKNEWWREYVLSYGHADALGSREEITNGLNGKMDTLNVGTALQLYLLLTKIKENTKTGNPSIENTDGFLAFSMQMEILNMLDAANPDAAERLKWILFFRGMKATKDASVGALDSLHLSPGMEEILERGGEIMRSSILGAFEKLWDSAVRFAQVGWEETSTGTKIIAASVAGTVTAPYWVPGTVNWVRTPTINMAREFNNMSSEFLAEKFKIALEDAKKLKELAGNYFNFKPKTSRIPFWNSIKKSVGGFMGRWGAATEFNESLKNTPRTPNPSITPETPASGSTANALDETANVLDDAERTRLLQSPATTESLEAAQKAGLLSKNVRFLRRVALPCTLGAVISGVLIVQNEADILNAEADGDREKAEILRAKRISLALQAGASVLSAGLVVVGPVGWALIAGQIVVGYTMDVMYERAIQYSKDDDNYMKEDIQTNMSTMKEWSNNRVDSTVSSLATAAITPGGLLGSIDAYHEAVRANQGVQAAALFAYIRKNLAKSHSSSNENFNRIVTKQFTFLMHRSKERGGDIANLLPEDFEMADHYGVLLSTLLNSGAENFDANMKKLEKKMTDIGFSTSFSSFEGMSKEELMGADHRGGVLEKMLYREYDKDWEKSGIALALQSENTIAIGQEVRTLKKELEKDPSKKTIACEYFKNRFIENCLRHHVIMAQSILAKEYMEGIMTFINVRLNAIFEKLISHVQTMDDHAISVSLNATSVTLKKEIDKAIQTKYFLTSSDPKSERFSATSKANSDRAMNPNLGGK